MGFSRTFFTQQLCYNYQLTVLKVTLVPINGANSTIQEVL